MITNLWRCFETTGDVTTYLCFKEYEIAYSNSISVNQENNHGNIALDRMEE
jgi:hypothetical protein